MQACARFDAAMPAFFIGQRFVRRVFLRRIVALRDFDRQ
jgi:hypothetical protein